MTWHTGKVHWFDQSSGEGMIKAQSGDVYYVHKSASKLPLQDGMRVRFELIEDINWSQVSKAEPIADGAT